MNLTNRSSTQAEECGVPEMSAKEQMFKEKMEENFGKMTKEEIIASLVSHVTSRTRTIEKCEKKAMESKGKERREWLSWANKERDERHLITRLHINLDVI